MAGQEIKVRLDESRRSRIGVNGEEGKYLTKTISPDRRIDLRGLYCPEPIFRTAAEMGNMKKGEVLEVLADDPAAEEDIKRWAKRTGEEILDFSKEGFDLRFLIRKAG